MTILQAHRNRARPMVRYDGRWNIFAQDYLEVNSWQEACSVYDNLIEYESEYACFFSKDEIVPSAA